MNAACHRSTSAPPRACPPPPARRPTGDPAIVVLHTTNGRWDIVAELRVETLAEFDRALTRVRAIEGVANSETSILLTAVKL